MAPATPVAVPTHFAAVSMIGFTAHNVVDERAVDAGDFASLGAGEAQLLAAGLEAVCHRVTHQIFPGIAAGGEDVSDDNDKSIISAKDPIGAIICPWTELATAPAHLL